MPSNPAMKYSVYDFSLLHFDSTINLKKQAVSKKIRNGFNFY